MINLLCFSTIEYLRILVELINLDYIHKVDDCVLIKSDMAGGVTQAVRVSA
jgi:hypothetical protein